jgi:seryl-tRNA synthetase
MDAQPGYREQLLAAGLLFESGVSGLYGRSGVFEDVVARLEAEISRLGRDDGAEVIRFPPAIAQQDFEISGYMKSFPQMAGTIHCFCGDERAHQRLICEIAEGQDWTGGQKASGLVMTPAACYPLYPVMARRGALPESGALVDVYSYCFRHEPSLDPARMQLFRQREYVRLGTPEQVLEFRETWMQRGQALVQSLRLPLTVDVANDPFFGRAGRIMSDSQRTQRLKFELLIPVNDVRNHTACVSFNYHMDHFGEAWDLRAHDGALAHTACVGFGMERLTLALFRHHGLDVGGWPDEVRAVLWGAE